MSSKISRAVVRTPRGWEKVLAVQFGFGVDMHGQDPTRAAIKAVEDAIGKTSLPAVLEFVPGGFEGVKIKAKIAVPNPKGVNVDEVMKTIPYGKIDKPKIVHGGMRWHSGIIIPELGDPPPEKKIDADTSDDEDAPITSNDESFAAVAAKDWWESHRGLIGDDIKAIEGSSEDPARMAEGDINLSWNEVLAVQFGFGVDMHGQDSTKAAVIAVEDALERTSLPAVLEFVPGGFEGVKFKAKIAVPYPQKGVDLVVVRSVFPYGKIEAPKIVRGGLRWHSGIIIPELGDPPPGKEIGAETSDDEDAPVTCNDESFAAVAAVRVGY
ncbi:hypothetical protein COCOBI_05-3400 [Coccomyxa sp. Obi]|nr:hypothetical protein COCOBI_05-3400 [Coccomyxa sp. Obi]